jgi:alpha-L-fucosidase
LSAEHPRDNSSLPAWFKAGKFGLFIHWGPYSILGGEWEGKRIGPGDIAEWIMHKFQIPVEEYRRIAATFNPTKFNAREWAALAKNAGMKYLVITAKHHDGFAMFQSKVSPYNIVDYTPFGRDPLMELSEACAEAGIKFCVYYSHREDWDHPYAFGNTWDFKTSQTNLDTMDRPELFRKYLDEKVIPQLKELLTNYGPLGIVWFDRGIYTQDQGEEFADLVHSLQPGCLVNGRVGHYDQELLGDYQSLTDNGMPSGGIEEYWESPQTLNDTWGYSRFDQNWKAPEVIIRKLVSVVSKGGNYLLNVGPTGEGIIPPPSVEILTRVGDWMRRNGDSIYGASPSPFPAGISWGFCTSKGNLLYLHVFDWPEDGVLKLNGLNNRVRKASLLADASAILNVNRDENGLMLIAVPEKSPDPIDAVVVLEIEGRPRVDPFVVRQAVGESLSLDYSSAATYGKAVKRFNRKGEEEQFHISKMQGPEDRIEWHIWIKTPGRYEALITYAALSGWEDGRYILESGGQTIKGAVQSTAAGAPGFVRGSTSGALARVHATGEYGKPKVRPLTQGWFAYKTESVGRFDLSERGETSVRLYPEKELDHDLMYFKSLELVPLKSDPGD